MELRKTGTESEHIPFSESLRSPFNWSLTYTAFSLSFSMKLAHLILIPLTALTLLVSSGCNSSTVKPRAFEVNLTIDKPLESTSLQVDLVGANALADLPKWTSYSVTEYWQPDNPQRRDASRITYQFGRGISNKITLSRDDVRWQPWLKGGVAYLVIMADLPGSAVDQNGNADSRRLIIPLDKKLWRRNDSLEILIQEGGIRLQTKQKKQS